MKKVIITCCLTMAVLASSVVLSSQKNEELNTLELANIEALTQNEGGSSISWDCWSQTEKKKGSNTWLCGNPCTPQENHTGIRGRSNCYSI